MHVLVTLAEAVAPVFDSATMRFIQSVTWPGALVLAAFSPPGKALASWLQSKAAPSSSSSSSQRSADLPAEVVATLKEISISLRRMNDVQTAQTEVLQQLQQSMAILLDRTARPVAQ